MLGTVRTGPRRRHPVAFKAKKRDIDLEWLNCQAARRQTVENVVGFERTIITSNPCMVAPNDQVGTAEILPKERVKERLARACIAHLDRIASLDIGTGYEIMCGERVDRLDPHLCRDVAALEGAQHLVDEDAVADLNCDLG